MPINETWDEGEYQFDIDDLSEILNIAYISNQISNLDLKFSEPLIISEKEYIELIGAYNYKTEKYNGDIQIDKLIYEDDLPKRFIIEFTYKKENDKIIIFAVRTWREDKK